MLVRCRPLAEANVNVDEGCGRAGAELSDLQREPLMQGGLEVEVVRPCDYGSCGEELSKLGAWEPRRVSPPARDQEHRGTAFRTGVGAPPSLPVPPPTSSVPMPTSVRRTGCPGRSWLAATSEACIVKLPDASTETNHLPGSRIPAVCEHVQRSPWQRRPPPRRQSALHEHSHPSPQPTHSQVSQLVHAVSNRFTSTIAPLPLVNARA